MGERLETLEMRDKGEKQKQRIRQRGAAVKRRDVEIRTGRRAAATVAGCL